MKVLCKTTCIAKDMGLGYCFAGKVYEVDPKVKVNHHFEKVKSPKEEIAKLKKAAASDVPVKEKDKK